MAAMTEGPIVVPASVALRELASAASPVAQFAMDIEDKLVAANARARAMFGVTNADIGRPFRDLEVSYRPIELRSRVEQAYNESTSVTLRDVQRKLADGNVDDRLDVVVWNQAMEDLFGVRREEAVNRSLLALDIGAPVGDVGPLLHAASNDGEALGEVTVDAMNRRGRPFRCRITVASLSGAAVDLPQYVVVFDEVSREP